MDKILERVVNIIVLAVIFLMVFTAGVQVGIYQTNKQLNESIDSIMNYNLQP